MKKQRPINLNLTTIHFPPAAIASILHRLSGVVLFLFIPFLLWLLQSSLASPEQFWQLKTTLGHPVMRFFVWILLAAFVYHLLAGIRHLIMDAGRGESLVAGRLSAYFVIGLSFIIIIAIGVWLWR